MKLYRKLMMALEMDDRDSSIIQFSHLLTDHYKPDSLYAVHAVPKLDEYYVDFIHGHWDDFLEKKMSLDEVLTKELENKVGQFFEPDKFLDIKCEILEGKPFKQLIHWADIKNIDLLIVGSQSAEKEIGLPTKEVVRKFQGSVLVVPDDSHKTMKKIVVPIDFSDSSAKALKEALDWKYSDQTEIRAVHVADYNPWGIAHFTNSEANFKDQIKENVDVTWTAFCDKNEINKDSIGFDMIERNGGRVSQSIKNYSEGENADLLIMGAKGHSRLELNLFGSTTEKVLQYEKKIPVLVMR